METLPNFYDLISEKTKDFVGREWVFNEIDNWLNHDSQNRSKYFIITGKAGSGKSTIAARLIEISNGVIERNHFDNQDIAVSNFKKIKKDFLDASYVISFKDNLSTDTKTFSTSIASQLGKKNSEFAIDLVNSTKTSNNININASQQKIQANIVYGASFDIDIQIYGSASALSIFNDLVRIPLESYMQKNPEKRMVFLIDGLDESITSSKEETYSDSIISILSNLKALKNVYFIITTRDYDNILEKFNKNSLILDISSRKYINYINNDVSDFVKLNINKKLVLQKYNKEKFTENRVNQLVEKAEGNFLYIKFVMDAIVEGKIGFSEEEINKIPSGLFGIYNDFFVRMHDQYGENNWDGFYLPTIRILLVSFEALNSNQISFFTGIEDNLQRILINLKPFIVEQKLSPSKSKGYDVKYKLYHQSLVEFLKKEYLDDNAQKIGHKKIVEKYYDKSKEKFKINLLKEYGLRYLPEHLFALFDYDDPEGIDWYAKLLELAKDKEFEEKQIQFFPFETNLPLKTIKRAYKASLEKDDPMSTAEMLLLYANNLKKVFLDSPLSILKNNNIDNNDVLEKSWRIADLYDKETRIKWYLSIAWYLDYKNKVINAQKTLDRLFEKELVTINDNIVNFFVDSLYEHYRDRIVKIFNHLSNDDICKISLFFFKNNNLKIGLEIFNYIRNKKAKINDYIKLKINLNINNKVDVENSLIPEIIEKSNSLSSHSSIEALSSIAQSLAQSNKLDEAIQIANAIDDYYDKSTALSSIAQSLVQSNKPDEAIQIANAIDDKYQKSTALSSIAQSLAQSNKLDEAIKAANAIEDDSEKLKTLSSIAQSLVQSNKLDEAIQIANAIDDYYDKSTALSSIAQSLVQSNKPDEAMKIANAIDDKYQKSTALSSIAQSLVQSNKPDEAIKAANAIEDDSEKLKTLSSIAQSLVQSNKLDEAIQIANAIDDYYDKSTALSSIAQSLVQSNKPDEAIQIANAIEDEYLKSTALSSIAQSLVQSNRLNESVKLFNEAMKIANAIDDKYQKSRILSSIAQSLVQSNKLDEAMKIANAIDDKYQKSTALSSIAQSLAQSNKLDEAIKAANAIEDDSEKLKTLSSIAQSLAQSNKLDEAIQIANAIEDYYEKSRTLSSIAQSLVQSNRLNESVKLLDLSVQATKPIDNNHFKAIAISKIAQSNRLNESVKLFNESMKIANAINNKYQKSEALSFIVQSLVQSNKPDEAIKAANAIEDEYLKSTALSSIAQSLAQSKRLNESAKLFNEAMKIANAIDNKYQKSTALSSIAQSLAQSNKLDEAIQIANALDDKYQKSILSSIAQSLAQSNRLNESAKLLDLSVQATKPIDNNHFKAIAISKIVRSLAQSNKPDEAIKAANAINNESDRSLLLSFISAFFAQSNKPDEAIKAANAIDDKYQKSTALSSIAQSLAQSNRLNESAKLFNEAMKIANAIDDKYQKSTALSSIAQSLVQSNKPDEAIQIANAIEDDSEKLKVLSKIIVEKLEVRDILSKFLLKIIVRFIEYNLYEMSTSSLKTQELWNYIMKQSIGYPEIAYILCSFITERYPKYSIEIANLILKYNF